MRLPDTFGQRMPFRFNITPMIDVVFLLIIFFLVASYFARSEQSRSVELPEARKGQPDNQSSLRRLTITIEKEGKLSIGGQLLSEASVLKRIRELADDVSNGASQRTGGAAGKGGVELPEVRIRSDRDAKFAEIRRLIEHCAASNIRSIRFAVASQQE